MSGEISNLPSLSFEFHYKTRLGYEPFDGTAAVTLSDVSLNYQFRPYSELHKHRFNDDSDQEEHPGGSFAISFDKV